MYEKQTWVNDETVVSAEYMNHIEDGIYRLGLALHPVGSIYMSTEATEPSTLFGGTWERIEGRFLLGAGSNGVDLYTEAGSVGGEANHQLTIAEMPTHDHSTLIGTGNGPYNYNVGSLPIGVDHTSTKTTLTGGGQPHNNMPPYLTVYMWKRVS